MSDLLKSKDGDTSSKRVAGFILLVFLVAECGYVTVKHPEFVPQVLQALTWGIGVCFASTAVEKIPGIGK